MAQVSGVSSDRGRFYKRIERRKLRVLGGGPAVRWELRGVRFFINDEGPHVAMGLVFALTVAECVNMGLVPRTEESVRPEPRIFLHCRPPFPVTGKPVVARFRTNLGPGREFTARFERDSSGNTRIELRDPASEIVHFAQLWSVKERTDKLVFYDERMVVVRKWTASAVSDAWLFGGFEAEWTDQHEKLAGHDARKVVLRRRSSGSLAAAQESGECWISEALDVVMRERIIAADGSAQEWEITTLDEGPPTGNVLAIPPGFKEF